MSETDHSYVRPYAAAATLIAAAVVTGFFPGARLWGLNHGAYLAWGFRIAFPALALLVLVLGCPVADGPLERPAAMAARIPVARVPGPLRSVFLLFAAGIGLWLLRGATTLLGDGSLVVREGSSGIPNYHAILTWIFARGVDRVLGLIGAGGLESAYRIVSVLAGTAFLTAAAWFPARLGWGRPARLFWLAFTLSSGVMVLFAGYVENYALICAGIYLYLVLGLLGLNGRLSPCVPLAFLAVAPWLHVIGVFCLPSALVIALRGKAGRVGRVALLTAAGAVGLAAIHLAGFRRPGPGVLLAPFGAYGILSANHLADLVNLLVLAAPALLLTVPAALRSRNSVSRPELLFLALLSLPFTAFSLTANPGLGLARDWDLFSLGVFVPAVAVAYLAARRMEGNTVYLRRLGLACLAVGTALTGPWLLVNHREASSVDRFSDVLRLYDKRSAYGYEILSHHWIIRGDRPRARQALQRAIDISQNPRYYGAMGNFLMQADDLEGAEQYYRQAVDRDSTDAWGFRNLGVCYGRMRRYPEAEKMLRRAVRLDPRFALAFGDLGTLFYLTGRLAEAREVLERALAIDPAIALNHLKIARVHLKMGSTEAAARELKTTLGLDPDNRSARDELERIERGER